MGDRVCQWCGGSIDRSRQNAVFCSRDCAGASWRDRNREYAKAKSRAHYAKNRELCKEKQRVWNAEHADFRRARDRQYYLNNREKICERQREWNAKNSAHACDYQRAKRLQDPETPQARDRKRYRTRAAAQDMQDALAAIPAIMALLTEPEKPNDQ